jgi:hypothetical protein
MTPLDRCPPASKLEEFLLGQASVADMVTIEVHLSSCASCAAALRSVRAEDDIVRAMRSARTPPLSPADLAEAEAIARRLQFREEATTSLPQTDRVAGATRSVRSSDPAALPGTQGSAQESEVVEEIRAIENEAAQRQRRRSRRRWLIAMALALALACSLTAYFVW